MIFVKRSKINVDFFASHDAIFAHAKPKRAASFIPSWWQNLPKTEYVKGSLLPTRTLKSCVGFLDLYASGFIVPMWCELNIKINPDRSYKYQFADYVSSIEQHESFQFEGSPFSKNYVQLKLMNPWVAKSKSSVKWIVNPPTWNGTGVENMHVAQGILRFDVAPTPLNLNLFFKIQQESLVYKVDFGTPLAHVVPLTEKNISYNYHLVDEKELKKMKQESSVWLFFSNRFNKSKKLCPYA